VRCQIWCAICAYLMVAILKQPLGIKTTLHEMLQITSVSIFEQSSAQEILGGKIPENLSTEVAFNLQRTHSNSHHMLDTSEFPRGPDIVLWYRTAE